MYFESAKGLFLGMKRRVIYQSWRPAASVKAESEFWIRISSQIRIQNRKSYSKCEKDLCRTDLSQNSKHPSHWYVRLIKFHHWTETKGS
jgi:hypothetical protein